MRGFCLWIGWICLFSVVQGIGATDYATKRLQTIASQLSLPDIDTLDAGEHTLLYRYKECPLTIRINAWHEVEHIGLALFSSDIKRANPSPVYDFLERYLLELNLMSNEEQKVRLNRDRVQFIVGTPLQALFLDQSVNFRSTCQIFRSYEVCWETDTGPMIVMQFDMNYKLLSGCDLIELETYFRKQMRRFKAERKASIDQTFFPETGDYYVQEGGMYVIPAIRNDLYYQREEDQWKLIFSPEKPAQSIANCMLSLDMEEELDIALTLDLYGYTEALDTTKYLDLLGFCQLEGCIPYFGMKEKQDDTYYGTLFMVNEQGGFMHMLSVEFPVSCLKEQQGILSGRLYVYIPLYNLSARFFENEQYIINRQ